MLVFCGCGQGCSSLNIRDSLIIILRIHRGNTFPQQSTPETRSSVALARTWRNTWWCLLFRPDSVEGLALTLPSFSACTFPLFPSLSLSPLGCSPPTSVKPPSSKYQEDSTQFRWSMYHLPLQPSSWERWVWQGGCAQVDVFRWMYLWVDVSVWVGGCVCWVGVSVFVSVCVCVCVSVCVSVCVHVSVWVCKV